MKDHCTRVILEVGAHTSPADLRITDAPGFYAKHAVALADAIEVFLFGSVGDPQPAPAPVRGVAFAEVVDQFAHGVAGGGGMLDQGKHPITGTGAGILTMGFPRSGEFDITLDGHDRRAQVTDTGAILYQPDLGAPWDVRMALIRHLPAILARAAELGTPLGPIGIEVVTLDDGRLAITTLAPAANEGNEQDG
jgi:hypothetical protein